LKSLLAKELSTAMIALQSMPSSRFSDFGILTVDDGRDLMYLTNQLFNRMVYNDG
jgi:hypothetical protein